MHNTVIVGSLSGSATSGSNTQLAAGWHSFHWLAPLCMIVCVGVMLCIWREETDSLFMSHVSECLRTMAAFCEPAKTLKQLLQTQHTVIPLADSSRSNVRTPDEPLHARR